MSMPASVAVILPAYNSSQTVKDCLEAICSQTYPGIQVMVVDSSPDDRVEEIVKQRFPQVAYLHVRERLLPHAARNLGVRQTASDLLIFTDPDIYAPPEWVENLVQARQQYGGVVIGALNNHGDRWLEWGIHLGKFDAFLPEREIRPLDFCATANMLCSRSDFEKAGGFVDQEMLGDLLISWKFRESHIPIRLYPQAVAAHHHTQSFRDFLRERFERGRDYGRLRIEHFHWSRTQILRHFLLTVSGLRLVGLMRRIGIHSRRAGCFKKFLYTLPVSSLGQFCWLSGEAAAFIRAIRS